MAARSATLNAEVMSRQQKNYRDKESRSSKISSAALALISTGIDLDYASELGNGTVFCVTLPLDLMKANRVQNSNARGAPTPETQAL
ncbi:MAG: hypothetical protein ACXW6J_23430 [Candidatus Binatia bacterium]